MVKRRIKGVFVALCLITGSMQVALAETVTIWGSTTCQKSFLEPGKELLEQEAAIQTRVIGVGTGKGLVALIHGRADAAAASSSLDNAIRSARKEIRRSRLDVSIPDDLMFNEIYVDNIVPIIHVSNPVAELTKTQLKGIYTGQIRNWLEVGGPDRKIEVISSSHTGSATHMVFQKQVMDGEEYLKDSVVILNTSGMVSEVVERPNAIAVVSTKFFDGNTQLVKAISGPKISRPLGIITRGEPSHLVQSVIDFYKSGSGRRYF